MKFVELRTGLSLKVEPIYLVFGSDGFLVNKAIELIKNVAGAVDVSKFDESDAVKDIVFSANTLSMFGGKRLIVVRRADGLLKEKEFVSYLKNPNPNCVVILTSESEKEPAGAKGIICVDCSPIVGGVLLKLIAKQVQDNGKNMSEAGAIELAKHCNNNYSRIDNEIVKLVNCVDDKVIDVTHVQSYVTRYEAESPVYEFGNALVRGNLAESDRILANLKAGGVDEYAIFGGLVSMFRRLYYSLCTTCENERVAKLLGGSPYAVMYARRDNRALTSRVAGLYRFVLDLEYKIKSGQVSIASAIEMMGMKLYL